eukprot:5485623-Prymnesium_polylepis.1
MHLDLEGIMAAATSTAAMSTQRRTPLFPEFRRTPPRGRNAKCPLFAKTSTRRSPCASPPPCTLLK